MTRLINELLQVSKDSALFATTRASNDIMQEMLSQMKFSQDGMEYNSDHNPTETLKLFVRAAPKIENI